MGYRYKKNPLANPYYPRTERRRPWKKILLGSGGGLIAIIIGICASPLLAVTAIAVEGAQTVPQDAVREAVQSHLSSWSRLPFVRNSGIENSLANQFAFESVSIRKKLPNTLVVSVRERTPFGVWHTGNDVYLFDQTGTVIRALQSNETTPTETLTFIDESGGVVDRSVLVSAERLSNAATSVRRIRTELEIPVRAIKFPTQSSSWIKVETEEGWEAYIDLASEVDPQLIKLRTILEEIGAKRDTLQYIDVRFRDRVYYQ